MGHGAQPGALLLEMAGQHVRVGHRPAVRRGPTGSGYLTDHFRDLSVTAVTSVTPLVRTSTSR